MVRVMTADLHYFRRLFVLFKYQNERDRLKQELGRISEWMDTEQKLKYRCLDVYIREWRIEKAGSKLFASWGEIHSLNHHYISKLLRYKPTLNNVSSSFDVAINTFLMVLKPRVKDNYSFKTICVLYFLLFS